MSASPQEPVRARVEVRLREDVTGLRTIVAECRLLSLGEPDDRETARLSVVRIRSGFEISDRYAEPDYDVKPVEAVLHGIADQIWRHQNPLALALPNSVVERVEQRGSGDVFAPEVWHNGPLHVVSW